MMMPYVSSSLSQSYDVFMSFKGEDTRMGFTSHLCDALTRNYITTYKDDKSIEIGNFIAPDLLEAIEASRFAVVVLSSNFATSKWCLEEIEKIVDCMERGKLKVIPVFYHVDPSDVRRQRNCFEQGFTNHEVDPEIAPQKVETWRAAFKKVGAIKGWHVTPHSNEAKVISEIVRKILKDMPADTSPVDFHNGLVGIEARLDEVKRILRLESSEVLFIGICGMSGIGKTTLAQVVYKDIQDKFERSCFIENIKDISKQNDSTDLCRLQQKLLDDILKDKSTRVQSVKHGQTLLATKLRGLKVNIVLDDVNHLDQLTYLAGAPEWFGPGSRIIITTTNTDVLNPRRINEIHRCEEMKGDEALKLFCQSAFEHDNPAIGYEKLSDDIVRLACGLPLALNVYGSLLCGKEKNYWNEMLKKLGEYPQKEVLGRLEVVYHRLDRYQRNAFMYIACFLKGRNKDLVKDILTNIGLFPECGITDLMNKFLITVNVEDNVWMHDLLQKMCWEILSKELHRYDGEHIAIKYRHDILDILSSTSKGTQTVEIINQEPFKVKQDDRAIDPSCFSKMTKLKFLRISNIHFRQGLTHLSNDLRILEWHGCSLKSLPSTFEPKRIYELEMCSSQLKTLWRKDLDLPNLRSINLSFSKDLTRIPNLTSALNLVKLNLEGCTKLSELHESVILQKSLRYMNLRGCTRLSTLGRRTMEMEALEALYLSGCSNLEYIPNFGENMKRLEHLYVDGTRIKKLPDNIGDLCDLRNLDFSRTFIEELPPSIYRLNKLRLLHVNRCRLSFKMEGFVNTKLDTFSSRLRELDLSYCNLSVVPDGIGLLYFLITLDLSGNDFVSLPASIGLLSKLRTLFLNYCKRLQSLPKLSLVDEDTDYGPRIRFNYYVAVEGVDVSKFHALSDNTSPTVSCLNCPKLAENERGGYLAEKVLNSYLQLRTRYWTAPEAVFEIVCAGSEIPSGFVQPGSDDLILEGPWIGVAICAVVAVQNVDGCYMDAKYVVTAHIHLGEKHWKISVPVNFLVADSENQLVFYWTLADDLQRLVGSSQKNNFGVSFSVEPGDDNLQVTKFGVRFINDEYLLQLKRHEGSLIKVNRIRAISWYVNHYYAPVHEANNDPNSSDSTIYGHTNSIIEIIQNYGEQRDSIDVIQKAAKLVFETIQEFFSVLSGCEKKWKYKLWIYCYYEISLGASILYNNFVKSLTYINDSWSSVKLALEQIVVKSRADYYTYKEMLQHLNDLEAAESVIFSDKFIKTFVSVNDRAAALLVELESFRMVEKNKSQSMKVLYKISNSTIACVFSMMASYIGDFKLLQEMLYMISNPVPLDFIRDYFRKTGEGSTLHESDTETSYINKGLRIFELYNNRILLQELTNKLAWSSCFTIENEQETMIVIDKLEKNISKMSCTIEKMRIHADKCSHDIRLARKHVKPYTRFTKQHIDIISKLSLFNESWM